MLKDKKGNAISSDDPEVLRAIEQFGDELLKLGSKVSAIIEAADKYPQVFLLQLYAATLYLYGQSAFTHKKAKGYLERAETLLSNNLTPRETSLYRGIKLWFENRLTDALYHFESHCLKWRHDLVSLKIAEFLYFCKGQQHQARRFLNLTSACYDDNQGDALFLSMYSFAAELTGDYEKARALAEKSIEGEWQNPWAHHTLGHVYINQGKIDQGIEVMEKYAPVWKESSHLIESHNLWHLGLLYLENLNFHRCLGIYDEANWKQELKLVGEEVDAAALLWRLDMEDIEVGPYWREVAEAIGPRANYGSIPFVSAQLCYALKRGEREDALEETLATLKAFTEKQAGEDHEIWQQVGLPLIQGSLAFADRDYEQTFRYFSPIIEQIPAVGGSDAQLDLFRQTYLKSLIGMQRTSDAKAYLKKLIGERSMTPLEEKWTSSI